MAIRDSFAAKVLVSHANCVIYIILKVFTKNKLNRHQLKDLEQYNLMEYQMYHLVVALLALIFITARE